MYSTPHRSPEDSYPRGTVGRCNFPVTIRCTIHCTACTWNACLLPIPADIAVVCPCDVPHHSVHADKQLYIAKFSVPVRCIRHHIVHSKIPIQGVRIGRCNFPVTIRRTIHQSVHWECLFAEPTTQNTAVSPCPLGVTFT
jgi:hypothetical protein